MLKTARLVLRPLAHTDAAEIARLISDWDVIRWLTRPPHPYTLNDAVTFIAMTKAAQSRGEIHLAITHPDGLMGVIGIDKRAHDLALGYWLGKPYWGKGYMTEAAGAAVQHFFATRPNPALVSGHLADNAPSGTVLTKLGFAVTGHSTVFSGPLGRDMPHVDMMLTRDRFETLNR